MSENIWQRRLNDFHTNVESERAHLVKTETSEFLEGAMPAVAIQCTIRLGKDDIEQQSSELLKHNTELCAAKPQSCGKETGCFCSQEASEVSDGQRPNVVVGV